MAEFDLKYKKDFGLDNLFVKKDKIYFQYKNELARKIRKFQNDKVLKLLFDKGIISDFKVKDLSKNTIEVYFPRFVLPFYTNEMTPTSRLEIGNLAIKLLLFLNKLNLTLSARSINRFFLNEYGKPFFYDFSGIVNLKDQHNHLYSSFTELYINPMLIIYKNPSITNLVYTNILFNKNQTLIINQPYKRKLLLALIKILIKISNKKLNIINFINSSEKLFLFEGFNILNIFNLFTKNVKRKNFTILNSLKKKLQKFKMINITQRWSNYYDHLDINKLVSNSNLNDFKINKREASILDIINKNKNESLLDIGCNSGFFSIMSGICNLKTIAMDNDVGSLDKLSKVLKNNNYKLPVTPCVKDFLSINNKELIKFKSDIVLALGFIHHMRLVEEVSWDDIAKKLFSLTKNILILEYKVDTDAKKLEDEIYNEAIKDYNLKNMTNSLKKYFSKVSEVGTFSAISFSSKRKMFMCKI